MYTLSQNITGTRDITGYFSDDIFNSSIVYQLPRIGTVEHKMSYLSREDLISQSAYSNSLLLGLVMLSVGSTIDVDSEGELVVSDEFKPLETINLKSLEEVRASQLVTVSKNTITIKETNPERSPDYEWYIYKSKRFQNQSED